LREAVMALRLALRPPEGISRPNAICLNNLIRDNVRSLNIELVRSILKEWTVEAWVERTSWNSIGKAIFE